MSLQFNNNAIGAMQYNGVTIGEAMMDGKIVFASGHPLPRSRPDYWYPLDYASDPYSSYGSRGTRLAFESGSFADRGQHAWVWDGKPRIEITEPWDGNFSFGAWFEKTGDNSGSQEWLFSRGWDGAGTCIYVLLPSGDKTEIALRIDDGTTRSGWEYSPKGMIPQSGWFHFAFTSEISDGRNQFRAYVNGVEVWAIRFIATFGILSFASTDWASVGNASTTANVSFNGNVDDIAFWSRTLSASEVAAIANRGRVPTESLGVPTIQITGTASTQSRDQFRQACIDYGTTYQTVEVLPFRLDTSQATNVSYMFQGCSSLTTVPDMDTSQATNMNSMFRNCSSITQVPDLDTSQVTDMSSMFDACSLLTQVPDLDTSNVTDMRYMFRGCSSLTEAPDLDTSQAWNLSYMFRDCSSLATVSDLDTSQAMNMAMMFRGCSSLTSVSDLDTSQATNLTFLFFDCASLTDGNVRCIGRNPSAATSNMITNSGLTREPFYDVNGNPI